MGGIGEEERVKEMCSEVEKWMNVKSYRGKGIERGFRKEMKKIGVGELVWNMCEGLV